MLSRIIWLFLFILLALVTGLVSLQVWRAYTARDWPTTPGVVVAFYETPNYKYSVGGRNYTNSYGSCNELFNSLWSMRNSAKYAVRYPLDAKVVVHYCRSRPGLAILETKFDASGLFVVMGLVLMTSVCCAGLVFGWRLRFRFGSEI